MPEIFRDRGLRFFFYSNEGTPREAVHIHVEKDGKEARMLRELQIVVEANRGLVERVWNEFFR